MTPPRDFTGLVSLDPIPWDGRWAIPLPDVFEDDTRDAWECFNRLRAASGQAEVPLVPLCPDPVGSVVEHRPVTL